MEHDCYPTRVSARRCPLRGFLVGPENQWIGTAITAVLERDTTYNPLVLTGPTGTGKTSLALGLADLWKQRYPKQPLLVITGSDFAREFNASSEPHATKDYQSRMRGVDLFCLDGLDELATKPATQQELVHTIDALLDREALVVVTARKAPLETNSLLPALQSRLSPGLTVPIALPGPQARLVIVRELAKHYGIEWSSASSRAFAESLPLSVAMLNGALLELRSTTPSDDGHLDHETVQRFIRQRSDLSTPTLQFITSLVARFYQVKVKELKSPTRRQPFVRIRGVVMYLARKLTGQSLANIGKHFGGRDHTTVLNACRKTEQLLKTDPTTQAHIKELSDLLTGR